MDTTLKYISLSRIPKRHSHSACCVYRRNTKQFDQIQVYILQYKVFKYCSASLWQQRGTVLWTRPLVCIVNDHLSVARPLSISSYRKTITIVKARQRDTRM